VPRAKPGPKSKFGEFATLCDEAFKNGGPNLANSSVVEFIRDWKLSEWPQKSRLHEMINEARERAKVRRS
jgi:hypothetical protein